MAEMNQEKIREIVKNYKPWKWKDNGKEIELIHTGLIKELEDFKEEARKAKPEKDKYDYRDIKSDLEFIWNYTKTVYGFAAYTWGNEFYISYNWGTIIYNYDFSPFQDVTGKITVHDWNYKIIIKRGNQNGS